jgi:hypothetical protein
MTRVDMERRLVKAEIAISLATALVRRQKEVLAGLKRRDYEATADLARAVLATLEESLRLHIEDCDQIARELDAATPVDGGPSLPGSLPRLRKAMPAISDQAAAPEMSEGVAKDYDGSAMLGRRDGREAKERPQ